MFDAWNGYHSVPLVESDRHLITFITPWGRYRYCTTHQGYIASDGYSRRFNEIVDDFPNNRSSIFKTCPHQQLPLMEGPPLSLSVDPTAKPVAVHTPIPVPLHWHKEVKAGLDQDVRLGVLEKVPVGDKVTWCHRMVVCAKKSGKMLMDNTVQMENLMLTSFSGPCYNTVTHRINPPRCPQPTLFLAAMAGA